MTPASHVVILGAGHAGGSCAALLRQYGHSGPITLAGDEPIAPYQRPPLSKAWLKGDADAESLALKPLSFYAENDIRFRPGVRGVAIDRHRRVLEVDDGQAIDYDVLVLATGARPVPLPVAGAALAGVMFLRTAADADALKNSLAPGCRLVIVGGGYIGLEIAASARSLQAEVTVLEREPHVLARVACAELSSFLQTYHRARGVRFEFGCAVNELFGVGGHVTSVGLADGRRIDADLVVIGIGARPNDELARHAGLDCQDGVRVNGAALTSDPHVLAIGDVTRRPLPHYGREGRLESVPNALEQAKQAATTIVGRQAPAPEVPWQWSDQYDLKLQIAGCPFDVDTRVVRGDPANDTFAVFHMQGDYVQAVEAVNAPGEFMMGRTLIGSRRAVDKARLADARVSMKAVAQ